MAFERPIEADRPDDLGLLSAFVRAPIIGTLFWIVGGDMAKNLEEEEKEKMTVDTDDSSCEDCTVRGTETNCISPVDMPGRISSEISDGGGAVQCSTLVRNKGHQLLATHKKMRASWSDESGQSLVEYFDETTSHEPPSAAMQVKSAMRQSSRTLYPSTHQSNGAGVPSGATNQFIPSGMNVGPGGGIKMPGGGSMKPGNGYISPQWGWYVSTTPPQGEMYHKKSDKVDKSLACDVPPLPEEILPSLNSGLIAPLPVFTKGIKTSRKGWPSVPL